MLIDIRCQHCLKLLGRVGRNFYDVIELLCQRCGKQSVYSRATLLKQLRNNTDESVTIQPPTSVSTRT